MDVPPTARAGTPCAARLTFNPGLQMQPTWSPDGRFIAYASDKSGNFDIWAQPVDGGDAVQITKHAAHDSEPNWSPDGSQIVFRSERQGGGLYLVPALGGDERRIAAFGRRPRWSPDGSRILFAGSGIESLAGTRNLYVARIDGSPPRQILRSFLDEIGGRPVVAWHPDGRRLSFWRLDRFWTIPAEGGTAVKSELDPSISTSFEAAPVQADPDEEFAWDPSGRMVYFAGISRGVRNIWRVHVDPATLRWVSDPERVTTGAGADTNLTLAHDGPRLAFGTSTYNSRIWAFPFDPNAGKLLGSGEPLTPQEQHSFAPDVTPDGRKVLVVTQEPGGLREERVKEISLPEGRERVLLVPRSGSERFAVLRWAPDGQRVVHRYYMVGAAGRIDCSIRTFAAAGEARQQITSSFLTPLVTRTPSSGHRMVSGLLWPEHDTSRTGPRSFYCRSQPRLGRRRAPRS